MGNGSPGCRGMLSAELPCCHTQTITRESTWEGKLRSHVAIQCLQESRTHMQDAKSWIWLRKSCTKWSHGGMRDAKATPALPGLLGGLFMLETKPGGGLIREGQCKPLPPPKSTNRLYLLGDAVFLHSVLPEGAQRTRNIN